MCIRDRPLRHAPRLVRSTGLTLGSTLALAGLLAAAALAWHRSSAHARHVGVQGRYTRAATLLPRVYTDGCDHPDEVRVEACTYGDTTASTTAVLLGDSHAAHFAPALERAAHAQRWRLVVMTRSACPWVDLDLPGGYAATRIADGCRRWRARADSALSRLRPDVVFVASASGYTVAPEAWEIGTRAALDRLAHRAGRVVLLPDLPSAGVRVPQCLARADWRPGTALDPDCRLRAPTGLGPERTDAQRRAARALPTVEVLDLHDAVCRVRPCAPQVNGIPRYRDSDHLSVDYAATLAPRFLPFLPPTPDARSRR